VIDDTAATFCKCHDGTHAFDIGAKATEDRQPAFLNQLRSKRDRLGEGYVFAIDLRIWFFERAFETRNRFRTAVLQNLQFISGWPDFQVIACHAAKRAGNVFEMICAVSRLFGL
jgi:hypothetical protein